MAWGKDTFPYTWNALGGKIAPEVLSHGLRNELQRERKSASQARSLLWLGGFPGRSIASVSEDESNTESQDTKQDDEDKIDEARPFVGNDNNHQHKNHDQRKQRQDSAYTFQIVGRGCGGAEAPSPEFLAGQIHTLTLLPPPPIPPTPPPPS